MRYKMNIYLQQSLFDSFHPTKSDNTTDKL